MRGQRIDVEFGHLGEVVVEAVEQDPSGLLLRARSAAVEAVCPDCVTTSTGVHSWYSRRMADTPLASRPVRLLLRVRRFWCRAALCGRRTFVEQVTGLTSRYARRTAPLAALLAAVGMALAGRAGARLAAVMAVRVSRSTLLRIVRAAPVPAVGAAPRILGVDDFALRRGQIYATVLIDMETHRPIDVLPDREAATLEAWLRAHPGAEVICRDRSGAYAEGARAGAPEAIQVADRFHLWRNLSDAVETAVLAHRAALPEPAAQTDCDQPGPDQPADRAETVAQPEVRPVRDALTASTPAQVELTVALAGEPRLVVRTRERHAAVAALLAQGVSRAQISRQLGLDPQTVRRFADATCVEELLANTHRSSVLDPFLPYLNERFNAGCADATVLHAELRERGYTGSVQTIRRHLHPYRATTGPTSRPASAAPETPKPLKPRQVARWIMTNPAKLAGKHQARLDAILDRCPPLQAVAGHVRAFAKMMHNLTGHQLPAWIQAVKADDLPGLGSFLTGINRDLDAVTNGLTLPYSSGAVEGHVNRIKMLKRQMFGRANLDLLRARILAP